VIAVLGEFAARPVDMTPSVVFWAGAVGSAGICAAVRLPVLLAYVAGVGTSRKHALVLSTLFVLGLLAGTVLLAATATPIGDGAHRTMQVNKQVFWGVGAALFIIGVLVSGLVNPLLVPEKLPGVGKYLGKVGMAGAFLSGGALGLLQTPACPHGGPALGAVVDAAAAGSSGLVLWVSFAVGQSLMLLAVGVLLGLLKPQLFAWLRTQMCSIEHRAQLLAGNVLMVVGLYFVIVG
jgi:cytochrome c-type biogenesis protein